MAEPTNSPDLTPTRRPRWVVWVIALAGVAVALGLVWAGVTVTQGRAASGELDRATQLVEEADVIVVEVDKVIGSQVTSELATAAVTARASVATASALLNEAVALIDSSEAGLSGSEAKRGEMLRESAEARLAMMLQAPAILDTNLRAATALPLAQEAWDHVVEADRLSDGAVVAYNRLTGKGVRESMRLNKRAAAKLAQARDGFEAAEQAFPEAAFEAYLAYVAMRVELNGLSMRSDADWIAGRLEQANAAITTYNDLDGKAVAAAKALPTTPGDAVAAGYAAVAKAATDEYYAARRRATSADAQLRGR
ncbi:MAG: hypothetical protein U1E26_02115 [Coriobacteriia bacterium]|nr:hypothetical protein [Coriobacteriia bacterium]